MAEIINNVLRLTSQPDRFEIPNVGLSNSGGILGLGGSDTIIGGAAPDLIYGNKGADFLSGNNGNDTIWSGRDNDNVSGNQGNDLLTGQRGNDLLSGGLGNDSLLGGRGDDILRGDGGTDVLTGGEGGDRFVLESANAVTDPTLAPRITDFNPSEGDLIAIDDNLSAANLRFESGSGGTIIRLASSNAILGIVNNVTPQTLANSLGSVSDSLDTSSNAAKSLGVFGRNQPAKSATASGTLNENDIDLYTFEVQENLTANLNLTGLKADADLELLQDTNGDGELGEDEILAQSQESEATPEVIENIGLAPGKYFVRLTQFEGSTPYELKLDTTVGNPKDNAGNNLSAARNLGTVGEAQANDFLSSSESVDYYRFNTSNSGFLEASLDRNTADVGIRLIQDANNNNQIDPDEVIADDTNELSYTALPEGNYFLEISAKGSETNYQLNLEASAGSRVATEALVPLFPDQKIDGKLTPSDDANSSDPTNLGDSYSLANIFPGQQVTLELSSNGFDPKLIVRDALSKEVLAENDDSRPDRSNSQVTFTVADNISYEVIVTSTDSPGLGSYELTSRVTSSGDSSSNEEPDVSPPKLEELPPPTFNEGKREDIKTKGSTYKFEYKPLAGSLTSNGADMTAARISDVYQQNFGDCSFIAATGALFGQVDPTTANNKASSEIDDILTQNEDGTYTARFYAKQQDGSFVPQTVLVDNQVVTQLLKNEEPVENPGTLFGASPGGNTDLANPNKRAIWVALLERAYAKWRGNQEQKNGYDVIGNGDQIQAPLERLLGKPVEHFYFRQDDQDPLAKVTSNNVPKELQVEVVVDDSISDANPDNSLFERIKAALEAGRSVTTSTGTDTSKLSGEVLVDTHAYTLTKAYVTEDGTKKVIVRNPWGVDNNLNKFFPEDPAQSEDGFVEMNYDRYLKLFQDVAISL